MKRLTVTCRPRSTARMRCERSGSTSTYRNSFVTDLPAGADTVAELAACGRARWKFENETFNVLKNKGYDLEHNFGHGKPNLAARRVESAALAEDA
nr:hypothetical protein [uncultured Rhodopila sp.]